MRKDAPRDSAASKTPGPQKRAAPSDKPEAKKKKPAKPEGGQSPSPEKKKKLLKPKVVLTKLNPGSVPQLAKTKAKEAKKETGPKTVKPKPKKVVVSKAKKDIKLENDPKRAKIVRAVKDVKKARSVVASKMAKISPKKLSDGTVRKLSGGKINVVKQHNIVKRVNKMSGKKPCVVSVKISNAHSTVTLSVKQNKQIGKKDSLKCSKSSGGKGNDRSTISIVKKGIASRRKSTSKECTSQESTPSQSPTRDTSPIRCKEGKPLKLKKSENVKSLKKIAKQSSIESKKGSEDKSKDKQSESQNKDCTRENSDGKTEVIINDTVKIKTENVGEDQNMEIEFTTSADKNVKEEKGSKSSESSVSGDTGNKSKTDTSLQDAKVKSPHNDYSNLKSVDSSTSDEIPLEVLKSKQKHIKQEKDTDETSQSSAAPKKSREGKESPRHDAVDSLPLSQRDDDSSNSNSAPEKKKTETEKPTKPNTAKKISKASLKKMDQESVAKLKISSKTKEKLKDLALKKQKVAKLVRNSKLSEEKHRKEQENTEKAKEDTKGRRRMKLLKFWNGPKRHRVASLNAIAKVHCLYENESRGAFNDMISSAAALQRAIQESKKLAKQLEMSREKEKEKEKDKDKDKEKKVIVKKSTQLRKKPPEPVSTRTLRTNPGVRSVGRNFDILNVISSTSLSSSSSEESSDSGEEKKQLVLPLSVKQKQQQIKKEESEQTTDDESSKKTPPSDEDSKDSVKKVKKRRRKRNELTMDLKDMVVRKRMASLNASAIMTASYSNEKKSREEKKKEEEPKKERKKKKKKEPEATPEPEESSGDEDLLVRTTNNKQKVAVIVNQDTDVTITGVYVNSTTRSTHHEGYCSIAGMQYRISSTSHTQTEATAVATETVLHAEHPACLPEGGSAQTVVTTALAASPCKSYTPLSALSSMQPPGHHHGHGPPPPCQGPRGPLSPLQRRHGCASAFSAPPNYPPPPPPGQPHPGPPPHPDVHGNYRWPIDMPCCSSQPRPLCYYQPAGPLISHHHHHHSTTALTKLPPPPTPPPSSDPAPAPAPAPAADTEVVPRYPYTYQYYPSPPASSLQYPAQYHHQDLCYPSGYPPGYFPKGHYPHPGHPGYRRYGHQYYPPQDFYNPPPQGSNPPPASGNQMMVQAPPQGPSEGNYPPPAPMVDPYPPPPPQSYYPGYSAGPPPPCYSTHSPSSRGLFIDAAYQGCPCPMQSCPKNVHTGPLTGASKGSIKNQTTPLPPVALALPLEPPGALGPPSPARGSAGMPPPPSPALATARNPPQSPPAKPSDQTGLLTIGKVVSDASVLLADAGLPLADFVPKSEPIKLEVEDIVKIEATEEVKCNRKRRKSPKDASDAKRPALEVTGPGVDSVQTDISGTLQELQERLVVKEEPEKEQEKQLPLSDNGATVPVKLEPVAVPNGHVKTKKRKLLSDSEPAAKVAKCAKNQKVPKKCAKKKVTEENVAPEAETETEEPAKVVCRRNSKPMERRKSVGDAATSQEEGKKKKVVRGRKAQEKTKADHLLRSHSREGPAPAPVKERRLSKTGSTKSDISPVRGPKKPQASAGPPLDPSADSPVCLPGLRRSLTPKWSNGWSWEGTPYKAKIFLNIDDGAVVRKCYPAMRHAQGDVITPRDCILLKAGPRKIDLPFVAKVAAMWENPDDGEMMVSLLWYYRPEHTEQGRRSDDIPDEIFASRHKDTNSVACIEDKCFVLTFNEYCRYRRAVRVQEEGLSSATPRLVPPPEGCYPRHPRQPPGRVAPDLVFFCRRVYDFRQKRILKNPC